MNSQTSYDVRIWKIRVVVGKRGTRYRVRWTVAGQPFSASFVTDPLADAFRSELVTATRVGTAFDMDTGRPASMRTESTAPTWYDFTVSWVDANWARSSGNQRKNVAKALVPVTVALTRNAPTEAEDARRLRTALREYAFNKNRRAEAPSDVLRALRVAQRGSQRMTVWEDAQTVTEVLAAIAVKLDGTPAARSTAKRNRRVLVTLLDTAVQRGVLTANPLPPVKRGTAGKNLRAVDKRCIMNPQQSALLLDWLKARSRGGPRLHAFFATQRLAGLRPEETVALRVWDATLPDTGWGELLVHTATPEVGKQWTNSGEVHDRRHLKGREEGETRPVPACPELTTILREHIEREELKPGDLLFQGEGGGVLAGSVYRRAWNRARKEVLGPAEYASPVAKRVYDLRHTCLTEWLNVPIPPAKVASWAGNSVAVLLEIYALCIDGEDDDLKRRIDARRAADQRSPQ